jgi:hypothetical protein
MPVTGGGMVYGWYKYSKYLRRQVLAPSLSSTFYYIYRVRSYIYCMHVELTVVLPLVPIEIEEHLYQDFRT